MDKEEFFDAKDDSLKVNATYVCRWRVRYRELDPDESRILLCHGCDGQSQRLERRLGDERRGAGMQRDWREIGRLHVDLLQGGFMRWSKKRGRIQGSTKEFRHRSNTLVVQQVRQNHELVSEFCLVMHEHDILKK